MQGLHEAAETMAKIIEWKTRFSTLNSLRKRPADVSADGCIHPDWKTIGADGTSRIYGENPSPTSLPKAARRAFRAPEGKRWMGFDWMQAEVRILAALSGDEALKEAVNSGDYHRSVYSGMSSCLFEDVTDDQREKSKVITYSILYSGGDSYHVATELGISQHDAAEEVRKYFRLFPKLKDFLQSVRSTAVSTRHVRSYMNRLRRLDGMDLRKIQNQACNSMGQQSCGTLLKIALIKSHRIPESPARNPSAMGDLPNADDAI